MALLPPPILPASLQEELSPCHLEKMTIGRSSAGTWRCSYKGMAVFYLKVLERGEEQGLTSEVERPEAEANLEANHEALALLNSTSIHGCPFDCTQGNLLSQLELSPLEDEFDMTRRESVTQLYATMSANDIVVASHGDLCLPNIIVDNGRLSGFVDLGRFGKGNPYRDIANLLGSTGALYNPF